MGRFEIATLPLIMAGLLFCAACSQSVEPGNATARIEERPAGTQDLDNAFSAPVGEGIAIVNGSQAASITVTMPDNYELFSANLVEELDNRANAGTEDFVAAAEADRTAAEEGDFDFRPHSLDVKWQQDGPLDGPLMSFLGTYKFYTGGAHGNIGFSQLNWDTRKDATISFEDMFADPEAARPHLAGLVKASLLQAKRERLNDPNSSDKDILETWVEPAFEGNQIVTDRFTIARSSVPDKAGGLVYHFAPYEVGSFAEGVYTIGVGYGDFEGFLSPDYTEAFGGDPILP